MRINSTRDVTVANKGDTVCRRGDWLDIAKFFLFNFVVHALTVVNAPGAKTLRSLHTSLTAILLPFSGAYRAFQSMAFYRWEKEGDLIIALRAQALCTTIPSEHHPTAGVLFPALNVIDVHGQHSVPLHGFLEWTGLKSPTLRPTYQLCRVPWWFAIVPLKQPFIPPTTPEHPTAENNPMSETKISCDYNVMKIFAAILQIFSGLFQIYQARGQQLERYGYSAYSLTVVPYVLMSLVNLFACLCIPQYPMMYIVRYGGKQRPLPTRPTERPETANMDSIETRSTISETSTAAADEQEASLTAAVSPIDPSVGEEMPLLRDGSHSPGEDTIRVSMSSSPDAVPEEDTNHFDWEPEVKDMVSGVVGVAYGDWDYAMRDKTLPQSETSVGLSPSASHILVLMTYQYIHRHLSGYSYISLPLSFWWHRI